MNRLLSHFEDLTEGNVEILAGIHKDEQLDTASTDEDQSREQKTGSARVFGFTSEGEEELCGCKTHVTPLCEFRNCLVI